MLSDKLNNCDQLAILSPYSTSRNFFIASTNVQNVLFPVWLLITNYSCYFHSMFIYLHYNIYFCELILFRYLFCLLCLVFFRIAVATEVPRGLWVEWQEPGVDFPSSVSLLLPTSCLSSWCGKDSNWDPQVLVLGDYLGLISISIVYQQFCECICMTL